MGSRILLWTVTAGLLLVVFGTLLFLNEPTRIDGWVAAWSGEWRSELLDRIMIVVTRMGNPPALLVGSVIVSAFFLVMKKVRETIVYLLSLFGVAVLASLLKEATHRARPAEGVLEMTSYAFPSWHAAVSAAFAASLLFLCTKSLHGGARILFVVTVGAWPLLIGMTRIYLHLHWFSDVLAGWGIGLFWTALVVWAFSERGDADGSA